MLTDAQIQTLDQLCREKGVRYYDLRQEIVDHLATEIEQQMERAPSADFHSLVAVTFETFGEKGLQAIAEAKEAGIQEAYQQCHRRYFWSFFTFPRIALIAICLSLPFTLVHEKTLLQIDRLYYLITALICMVTILGILLQPGKARTPLLLLTGIKRRSLGRNIGLLLLLLSSGFNTLRREPPSWVSPGIQASFFIFVTISYSLTFIARYHAVLKMYAKAKREFPLAFMKKIS